MNRPPFLLLLAALWPVGAAYSSGTRTAAEPIRTLILSDGLHPGSEESLHGILNQAGRFDARVCQTTVGLAETSLASFDLIVLESPLPPGGVTEGSVLAFVASGKGVVAARRALAAYEAPGPWPLSARQSIGVRPQFLQVRVKEPGHPILEGLPAESRVADDVPPDLQTSPGAEVLLEVTEDAPLLAVAPREAGRMAAFALGSDPSSMHDPRFRGLFARVAEWAATGVVTLPAVLDHPPRPKSSIRALLITGGHDHEAEFYSVFRGIPEVGHLPVDTAANAFKQDLREKYDVIVMYDFTRDLDEASRKNLREFVEDGHGVVVLHHAILNHQHWDWWRDEVVGGRYRLSAEGDVPSSSYKDGQTIDVSPAGRHPVLDGVGAFRIVDEAYKNLSMAQGISPLLTTDHPLCDANLAWVGPCRTSRVVAIQLGHGTTAFDHPAYRRLVHNAILWAGDHPD